MIFVDSNVFIYAVGKSHPRRQPAAEFFINSQSDGTPLCTSSEVLQELLHVYHPVARSRALNEALALIDAHSVEVWSLEKEDVTLACQLGEVHRSLSARDLCHLASCRRRNVNDLMTFDQSLRVAFDTFS